MKTLRGKVVSTKMQKTIIVQVERKFRHPQFGKVLVRHKKYKVHCEDKNVKEGDRVTIMEMRPVSREKHFTIIESKKT